MNSRLVIGVGNCWRGDDGAGPAVARQLQALGIEAIAFDGDGAELMELWRGAETVYLVDATRSGSPPGTLRRFDAHREDVPHGLFQASSHLFGVAEAIATARVLSRLPSAFTVIGIEGKAFDFGEGLSPEVAAAVEVVTRELANDPDDPVAW